MKLTDDYQYPQHELDRRFVSWFKKHYQGNKKGIKILSRFTVLFILANIVKNMAIKERIQWLTFEEEVFASFFMLIFISGFLLREFFDWWK